jgi:D-3-phosphoglycerate dehydrogenase / 2-oxoglutarate reductase
VNSQPIYIFDFDSTLTQLETLEELARIALSGHPERTARLVELQRITDLGMAGNLSFNESLRRRLPLFQANRRHVDELIYQLQYVWTPSIQRHRAWFREQADRIYVVSGGFSDYIEPLASTLGIDADHIFANQLVYDAHKNIVGFNEDNPLSQSQGKAKVVASLKLRQPVIMIGDGYTDYEVRLLGAAEQFWAFTENVVRPRVVGLADRVLESWPAEITDPALTIAYRE